MDIKDLLRLLETVEGCKCGGSSTLPFEIGKQYFIRTITHHYTGRCEAICGKFIRLDDAAWIPDDGRFADMLKKCEASEVEPFLDPIWLNTDTILEATLWRNALPRSQK